MTSKVLQALFFQMWVGGCEASDMKRIFYSHSRITHFLVKVFALNMTLKVMFSGTWKWSILFTVV